eukprot:4850670-Prorocentrum_lima.AAC.1
MPVSGSPSVVSMYMIPGLPYVYTVLPDIAQGHDKYSPPEVVAEVLEVVLALCLPMGPVEKRGG